jgi:hypothetical protein
VALLGDAAHLGTPALGQVGQVMGGLRLFPGRPLRHSEGGLDAQHLATGSATRCVAVWQKGATQCKQAPCVAVRTPLQGTNMALEDAVELARAIARWVTIL